MGDTKIEWCDKVWNPITGCSPASTGCKNCYAAKIAKRFWGKRKFSDVKVDFGKKMRLPYTWKEPRKIFVNSMGDVFHPKVAYECWRYLVGVMTDCERHKFLILTKRPERMREFVDGCPPTPNVWVGVSIEDQNAFTARMGFLQLLKIKTKFVSCEPLLGPLNLDLKENKVQWVIVGPETGVGKRRMDLNWAYDIYLQCRLAHVPFFYKGKGTKHWMVKEWPKGMN